MARKHLNGGTLTAPLPPALVTVGTREKPNVLTVAWTGILATRPPRTYISVRPTRYSHRLLKENGEFVLHLPTESMVRAVDYAGIYTGAKVDKFAACGFTAEDSLKVAPPTISECPIALECRVAEVLPMGTHDVFIADILNVSCDEGLLDAAGKLRVDRAHLLAYAHGEYYALGKRLGAFGFSAAKKKKKRPQAAAKKEPSPQKEKANKA